MKKKHLFLLTLLIVSICITNNFALADSEYIMPENISSWKQNYERVISNPNSTDVKTLKTMIYQTRYPDNRLSSVDKEFLKKAKVKLVNSALQKANACYMNKDYINAQNYYQIVTTNSVGLSKENKVLINLNLADIKIKQNKKGAGHNITEAISELPNDARIIKYIDSNISKLTYSELRSIAFKYSQVDSEIAIKYYTAALNSATTPEEKAKMQQNISICKQEAKKITSTNNKTTSQPVSEQTVAQSENLMKSSYKKFQYKDYAGALADLEQVHKINPEATIYSIVYPYYGIAANDFSGVLREINNVINQNIRPFSGTHKQKAYNLRGSLYLYNGEFDKAISDFSNALKSSDDEYDTAWQGLILAYLMSGNVEKAKYEINRYNSKSSYYQFADCSTYSDKILLNLDYKTVITYSAKENDKLNSYIVNKAMNDYFYCLTLFYSWFQ